MFLNPKTIIQHTHISPGMLVGLFESYGSFFPLEVARVLKDQGTLFCVGSNKDILKKIFNDVREHTQSHIEIVSGNIERFNSVPLRDESLDLVIIANVFFTVENKKETIKEAYRLLRKGGRVLFVDWVDSFGGIGPSTEHVVSKDVAESLFLQNGFELQKEIDAHKYHYAIIFKKI